MDGAVVRRHGAGAAVAALDLLHDRVKRDTLVELGAEVIDEKGVVPIHHKAIHHLLFLRFGVQVGVRFFLATLLASGARCLFALSRVNPLDLVARPIPTFILPFIPDLTGAVRYGEAAVRVVRIRIIGCVVRFALVLVDPSGFRDRRELGKVGADLPRALCRAIQDAPLNLRQMLAPAPAAYVIHSLIEKLRDGHVVETAIAHLHGAIDDRLCRRVHDLVHAHHLGRADPLPLVAVVPSRSVGLRAAGRVAPDRLILGYGIDRMLRTAAVHVRRPKIDRRSLDGLALTRDEPGNRHRVDAPTDTVPRLEDPNGEPIALVALLENLGGRESRHAGPDDENTPLAGRTILLCLEVQASGSLLAKRHKRVC